MTELRKQLQGLSFWEHLSETEKNNVEATATIREYQRGNLLHATEGDCLGMVFVLEGSVRAFMMSEEGREITLYHIKSGAYDVLTASCILYQITFDTQMVVEEDSRILIIPTTILSGLKMNNIYVRSFIFEVLTERFSDVMWTIQQILFYGLDQRIAAYLINHAENHEVKATHEQIAREINTAREVVARIIKHFAEDGIVETKRGKIIIIDWRKLQEFTGDMLMKQTDNSGTIVG